MFERFTAAARAAVIAAQLHARETAHPEIGADDLLAGVLSDRAGAAAQVLAGLGVAGPEAVTGIGRQDADADRDALGALGIDLDAVRRQAEQAFGPGALDRSARRRSRLSRRGGQLPFNDEAKHALKLGLLEAIAEQDTYLGTEHLLLGLLATDQGTATATLRRLGVTQDRSELKRLLLAERHRRAA